MRPSSRKTLEALAASMTPAAFRALLADIRAAEEAALAKLGAPKPAPKAKAKTDPLVTEVTALLAPILARSAEKGEMLVDHLETLTGKTLSVPSGGLPATVRALRKSLSDEDIRDGAYGLRVTVQREHALTQKVK